MRSPAGVNTIDTIVGRDVGRKSNEKLNFCKYIFYTLISVEIFDDQLYHVFKRLTFKHDISTVFSFKKVSFFHFFSKILRFFLKLDKSTVGFRQMCKTYLILKN